MESEESMDIAIIGMAGRFPGAQDVSEHWSNIRNGRECITHFSVEELEGEPSLASNPDLVRARGVLEGAELFDADFFRMTADQAAVTNPQFRLFLETCWTAMESAGYVPDAYPGVVSVYGGSWRSGTEYILNAPKSAAEWMMKDPFSLMRGNDPDFLTSTVAQKLNFQGESVGVQATCPAGLVGLYLGVQSLLSYQSDLVLAGASCVPWPQKSGYLYQANGPLSPDGRSRPFDRRAAGSPIGSGVGAVVLKRLEDAIAHGDQILAVVKGVAMNNDGARRANFNTPTVDGQTEVIARALSLSGVPADTIGYMEASGLATVAADAVELESLARAYSARTSKRGFCAVGASKANIGHSGLAAGVAGLVRAIQALRHRELPPAINCEEVNPQLKIEQTPFYLPKEARRWDADVRRAAVNSFGGGGQNVHLVLEEAPASAPRRSSPPGTPQLLTLSAHTPSALKTLRERLAAHLPALEESELEHVAYTLNTGRKSMKYRWAAVASSKDDLLHMLNAAEAGAPPQVFSGETLRTVTTVDAAGAAQLAAQTGGLSKLAQRWVGGDSVAWQGLYEGRGCRRVSLPTSPFERKRHLLSDAKNDHS